MLPDIKIITKDRLGQQMSSTREACKSTPFFSLVVNFTHMGKFDDR